jgi:ketosteroid isomerase-like protein
VGRPSPEIVEQLKQTFAGWNSGSREIDYETIDPEVELHTPLSSTQGGPYRGHDGFRDWIADIDEQFETWELRGEEWLPLEDDRLLVLGSIRAKGRGSGLELDQELAWLFTLRNEKMVRYDAFYDQDEGLRAAGLKP